jgi:hypothetical protein
MKRFAIFLRSRFGNGFADFGLALILAMTLYFETQVSAEIVFQDFFRQPATNLTNSVPWMDVDGNGWPTGAAASQLVLDGGGRAADSHRPAWLDDGFCVVEATDWLNGMDRYRLCKQQSFSVGQRKRQRPVVAGARKREHDDLQRHGLEQCRDRGQRLHQQWQSSSSVSDL